MFWANPLPLFSRLQPLAPPNFTFSFFNPLDPHGAAGVCMGAVHPLDGLSVVSSEENQLSSLQHPLIVNSSSAKGGVHESPHTNPYWSFGWLDLEHAVTATVKSGRSCFAAVTHQLCLLKSSCLPWWSWAMGEGLWHRCPFQDRMPHSLLFSALGAVVISSLSAIYCQKMLLQGGLRAALICAILGSIWGGWQFTVVFI